MKMNKLNDLEVYQIGFEIAKIGNQAVKSVKNENKRLGVPLVYSRNGEIFYELPDGSITKRSPFQKN